ncbi:glyoxalase domain-containing protein 4-like, partial [Penaeus indicus]|uniref:glyoxalase domain-containing protein 4-like n=1 Tax=Penaeus indicus TaxID=29960 RepID=UPI00300D04AD
PVQQVVLASSKLEASVHYWNNLAGLTIYGKNNNEATFGFHEDQAKLVLRDIGIPVNHAKAFGRIAFAAPGGSLLGTEEKMKEAGQKIITPYVSLDTPGKATVQVVILADPFCKIALGTVAMTHNQHNSHSVYFASWIMPHPTTMSSLVTSRHILRLTAES